MFTDFKKSMSNVCLDVPSSTKQSVRLGLADLWTRIARVAKRKMRARQMGGTSMPCVVSIRTVQYKTRYANLLLVQSL